MGIVKKQRTAADCTKKKFFSKESADKCIEYVQEKRKKQKNMRKCNIISSYQCPYCHFWHTTSMEQWKK